MWVALRMRTFRILTESVGDRRCNRTRGVRAHVSNGVRTAGGATGPSLDVVRRKLGLGRRIGVLKL